MRERPILFSSAMVRAILDGRKTMTRRVVKPQPHGDSPGVYADLYNHGPEWAFWLPDNRMTETRTWPCPYGVPGNRLWVRETWQDAHPCAVQPGRYSQEGRAGIPGPPLVMYRTIYRASGGDPLPVWHPRKAGAPFRTSDPSEADPVWLKLYPNGSECGWTPSIRMPRWASRLTLEVTAIRVERLQAITDEDAHKEGCIATCRPGEDLYTAGMNFARLWDSINGKRPGCAWGDDPWVWVVEFKRIAQEAPTP